VQNSGLIFYLWFTIEDRRAGESDGVAAPATTPLGARVPREKGRGDRGDQY
jgi:hypothetical protein